MAADFLPIVSRAAPQPILCKDFTIDLTRSTRRYYQADACLLMLSVLDDEQYRQLGSQPEYGRADRSQQ